MKHRRSHGNRVGKPRPASVELAIDELVLFGFSPWDRYRIADAAEYELTRLFMEQGIPQALAQGSDRSCLDGGQFKAKPEAKADPIGAQVAEAIYGGLKG